MAWLRFFSEGVLTLISRSQEYGSEEEASTGHAGLTFKALRCEFGEPCNYEVCDRGAKRAHHVSIRRYRCQDCSALPDASISESRI
jgi:hypothetical protein